MAKKYNVNLEVLSSYTKNPGTKIKEVVKVEKMLIRGVARDNDVARISIIGVPDQPGIAFKIFFAACGKEGQCRHHFAVDWTRRYKGHQLYSQPFE